MPRLPPVSGRELIGGLERLGFVQTGQSASHVKLRRGGSVCIVPMHRELKRGTLAGILRQAGLSVDDLLAVLTQ